MLRIEAALTGRLDTLIAGEEERAARAITAGTHIAADRLKARLRAMVVAAFGSERLARSWRGISYPMRGQVSLGPADLVFSKAPHIMAAFSAATTITGREGRYLAIPTEAALAMRFGNRRATPDLVEQRLGTRLRFVYRPGKASLLIAEGVRRRTGKRPGLVRASQRAQRTGTAESVVMFLLVKQVTLKRRFDFDAEQARAGDDMLREIIAQWGEER